MFIEVHESQTSRPCLINTNHIISIAPIRKPDSGSKLEQMRSPKCAILCLGPERNIHAEVIESYEEIRDLMESDIYA